MYTKGKPLKLLTDLIDLRPCDMFVILRVSMMLLIRSTLSDVSLNISARFFVSLDKEVLKLIRFTIPRLFVNEIRFILLYAKTKLLVTLSFLIHWTILLFDSYSKEAALS